MVTLKLGKRLVLLALMVLSLSSSFAQTELIFRGKALFRNKPMAYADILVYENDNIVAYTTANQMGSFKLKLLTQKKYLLKIESENTPAQYVVVSTETMHNRKQKNLSVKPVTFNFPSKGTIKLDKNSDKYVASFSLDKDGTFSATDVNIAQVSKEIKQKEKDINKVIKDKETEIKKVDNAIVEQKKDVEEIKTELPSEEAKVLDEKLQLAMIKIDSMLMMVEKKSDLILQRADLKAKEIVADAVEDVSSKEKKENKVQINVDKPTKTDLKTVGIDEKKFYEREDVKKYDATIKKYESSGFKSEQDSIEYYQSLVKMNKAMLDYAKMQLEIDRLNARTQQDSLRIKERERLIALREADLKKAEETIENQKLKIKNQKLEIDNQRLELQRRNLMLILTISGLVFFVVLFFVMYQNYRLKKKTNAQLEKQNQEIALKNKKIIDSITYAKTIQQAILPLKSAIDKYFESFIIFHPKDIVSGDFYWFTHFADTNTSVFAVVDCTGHGVPGAFMSMIGNRLLVEVINESKITDPKEVLEKLDEGLRHALMQDETLNNDGMDMCVCTIHKSENGENFDIEFAGAKRPLFYTHNNQVEFIKGTVRGIGGRARLRRKGVKPFVGHKLKLNKGDMLYLTTDGFLDLQSPERKKFGRKNFIEVLGGINQKTMEEQHYHIVKVLDLHKGDETQIDDITIMGIKL